MSKEFPKIILRDIPDLNKLDVYTANGGFSALKKCLTEMTPDDVIEEVKKSNLKGRGGACFPTGLKWSFMPKESDKPRYLACNGDESEPGSFKDREIFEKNPFQFIEGALIAAYAIKAEAIYVYIRGEYWKWINIMKDAIKECYDKGYIGRNIMGSKYSCEMVLYKGAGAYICGEESAMMNSLEGKRGYPRIKPPFPAQKGLWDCPTTINNIETLACVPEIIKNGADWFASIGAPKHPGTLLYGVSGHVNKPGVYELPSGTPLMTIINEYAGGVLDGKKIKMVIPGGSSMPPLTPKECENINMDNESLKEIGSAIGTGGIIVMNEDADLVEVLTRITHFYYHESCGQCTPCREGCGWMLRVLERIEAGMGRKSDLELLVSVAKNIEGNTICALGEAAAWPVKFTINKFYDEFAAKIPADEKDLPVMNKVHALRESPQYEVLRNDKEQEIVEGLIGKVRENVKEKRSSM